MPRNAVLAFVLMVLVAAAWRVYRGADVAESPAPQMEASLTSVYEGVLPCADCEGIATSLTLSQYEPNRSEGTFQLGETYMGEGGSSFASEGVWTTWRGNAVDENATVVVLNPDSPDDEQRYYERMGGNELRLLDRNLNPIESDLNYVLTRKD